MAQTVKNLPIILETDNVLYFNEDMTSLISPDDKTANGTLCTDCVGIINFLP